MKRSRVIPALALTAALTLAGCSGGVGSDLGVAVEGSQFSVTELQQATTQLNEVAANLPEPSPVFQPTSPQQVVNDLALLPLLSQVFAGSPWEVTEAQAREFLGRSSVSEPGEATVEATRSRQYQNLFQDQAFLTDPASGEVLARAQTLLTQEELAALDVELNPRYGTWDAANGVVPGVPEWIKTADDS